MENLQQIVEFVKFIIFTVLPVYQTLVNVYTWILLPALVMANPALAGHAVTQHDPWPWSRPSDLNRPDKYGLHAATNFRLNSEEGEIGVWHIPPGDAARGAEIGSGKRPVIIYCHGNTDSRGKHARVQMYKMLIANQYHVMTFDYRGYGDSSDGVRPTEATMVHDAITVYDHADMKAPKDVPFFIWGHSLGSGVACRLARELDSCQARMPAGVVLEAPFYHLEHLVQNHAQFKPWAGTIFYERHLLDCVGRAGFQFLSCDHVTEIRSPIIIFHSDDDEIIKFELGFRLYQRGKSRKNGFPREFYGYVGQRGMGHSRMFDARETPAVLEDYVSRCCALQTKASGLPRGTFPTKERRSSDTWFFGLNLNKTRAKVIDAIDEESQEEIPSPNLNRSSNEKTNKNTNEMANRTWNEWRTALANGELIRETDWGGMTIQQTGSTDDKDGETNGETKGHMKGQMDGQGRPSSSSVQFVGENARDLSADSSHNAIVATEEEIRLRRRLDELEALIHSNPELGSGMTRHDEA